MYLKATPIVFYYCVKAIGVAFLYKKFDVFMRFLKYILYIIKIR